MRPELPPFSVPLELMFIFSVRFVVGRHCRYGDARNWRVRVMNARIAELEEERPSTDAM